MLKTTVLSQVLVANEMFTTNEFGSIESDNKLIEKYGKLLKNKKLAKSKKLSKSGNSPNFDAKEAGPSFLIPKARTNFNRLWLTFTKAPIL